MTIKIPFVQKLLDEELDKGNTPVKTPEVEIKLPKSNAETMDFPEIYPGRVSEVVSQMGKAPGMPIKIPFIQKEFTRPKAPMEEMVKWAVELPEKMVTSFKELPYVIREKDVPEYKAKLYRVPSYAEDAKNMTKSLMDLGYSEGIAITAAILQTSSQAIIDTTIVSSLVSSGARQVAKLTSPTLEEKVASWKMLGQPKTIAEATKNRNVLAKQFHPDLVGEQSTKAMAQINDAYSVVKKAGTPTRLDMAKLGLGRTATPMAEGYTPFFARTVTGKLRLRPASELLKPSPALRGIKPTPETLPFKQLPGYAPEPRPTGLRGLEIEKMKPVGKAKPTPKITLEPQKATKLGVSAEKGIPPKELEQEAIKFAKEGKSAEEFVESQKSFFHGTSKETADALLRGEPPKLSLPIGGEEVFGGKLKVFSLTPDKSEAMGYVEMIEGTGIRREGKVVELFIAPNAKIVPLRNLVGIDDIPTYIKNNKIDAFREGTEISVVNPNILKTKTQLTDIYAQATKGVKEVKPVVKPKDEFEAYLEKEFGKVSEAEEEAILGAEFQKEANTIKKETEGQLFKDIRDAGGIKSFRGKFLAEELRPIPLNLKNNKTGMPLDEMVASLNEKGYMFDSDSDLLETILNVKKVPTIKTLKTISEKMPEKTAKVSQRLLNKLYRMKYPKVPAVEKSVRRAIEAGKISPEFEGKTISEMRKTKGFVEPKSVPTERLSIFENFINLNKIARKNVPYKQMGIAEIIRGDKTSPAIRKQSGFYATKEIQTAPINDVYSQLLSPYHMAMRQDGYKLGGEFGVMFKKVWKPTQKAIRGEKEFINLYFKTIKDIGERHKIKTTGKNLEHLSDVMERKVKATPQEEAFRTDVRRVLDDLRNQANDIRRKMRKDEIGYITNYISHIQKTTIWNELLSNVATISDNLDFIIPNAVRNPFAFRRLSDEMPNAERNLYILLDKYIRAIGKDIYITPAIENIKVYNSVLKSRELFKASKYWDEYIRTGLIGKQHKLDSALSIEQTGRKRLQKWNNMVNLAFLTGKLAWNVATQPLSYIMNVPMEAGIKNSITAIYNSRKKGLRKYVKENSDVLAIKTGDVRAVAIGEGRNIQNRIYRTKINTWNDFISMIGSAEERELTLTSYIAGLERAKDLGYKGQDALDFADLTAARTQSMYNKENRALALDSDIARTLFPFQSFSVEMFNHLKEISAKGGAMELNARQRTGKLFRLLVGIYLSSLYAKALTGREKTTVGTFFPFVGSYIDMLIAQATKQSYYGGRSPITVVQISQDVIKGSKDFIEYGDVKKLRKVGINFGLALGGIGGGGQINNIIDGIMADIDEEVRNVKGDTMFEVEDAMSKIKAPFFGVWATKEGREYFEPKKKKKTSKSSLEIKIPEIKIPEVKVPEIKIPEIKI